MLRHRRSGSQLHQNRDPAAVLQALLAAPHGSGQTQLPAGKSIHLDLVLGVFCARLIIKVLCLVQLVDTTVELANKVGAAEIISRIVDDLKDEAEQYRKMVMETIEKIMGNLGAADIDHKLEEQLIDGILYAFQEQTTEVSVRRVEWFKCDVSYGILTKFFLLYPGFGDAERLRHRRQRPGEARQALPAADLRYGAVASQQQVGQSAPAGRRPHLPHGRGHEDLPGGWSHESQSQEFEQVE